jgi:hypothetical protein
MTEEEKRNWKSVQYRMKEEGFNYCFDGYSNWDEIKDEKFHELRLNYLKAVEELKEYINKKNKNNE